MTLQRLEKITRIRAPGDDYWLATGRVLGNLVIAEGENRATARVNWVLAADHSLERSKRHASR